MHKPSATLSPLFHRGSQHIKVGIANGQRAIDLVKKVPGRKWSKTHRCWYVPYTPGAYMLLRALFEVTVAGLPEQGRQMAIAPLPDIAPTHTAARPTGNTPPATQPRGPIWNCCGS